ncbi:MAG: CAP domain-containing protein [Chthonomonas sp.]|nr:CAP domain-containing protein [Chthonomonas sp.]
MKTRRLWHGIATASAFAMALCCAAQTEQPLASSSSASTEIGVPIAGFSETMVTYAREVLVRINQIRSEEKLKPVRLNWKLAEASLWHAKDMASKGYFDHKDSLGRTSKDRIEALGIKDWKVIAQNIAGGAADPATVVKMWMDSPGHRKNILRPDVTEMGIGYYFDPDSKYLKYWVQDFLGR